MPNIDIPSSFENIEADDSNSTTPKSKVPERVMQYDQKKEAQEQHDDHMAATRSLLQARDLSDQQIEDLLDTLDRLEKGKSVKLIEGSGTASGKASVWFYDAIDAVREVGKWPHPHLSEWKKGPVGTVKVVVHPLFSLFIENFDSTLWEASNRNPDLHIEAYVVNAAQIALAKLKEDPSCIPLGYFLARDILEEWEALHTKVPNDSLRVLDLSRRALVPDQQRVHAYDTFLRSIEQDRTVVVDSFEPGTGLLQDKDLEQLNAVTQNEGSIEIQGGYLNACVDAAAHSIARMVHQKHRNDISLTIDSAPSTGSSSVPNSVYTRETLLSLDEQISSEMRAEYSVSQEELDHLQAFQNTFIKPPNTPLSSLENVRQWISQNNEANQRYDHLIRFTGRLSTHNEDNKDLRGQYQKIKYK
ncbi:hypothetical protein COU78_05435 [Candidatus Peregrinibacteria bacterium CG10_big_fil_rev_8_21_14_0_10_49_24]|nr:MAG: hypothetical protein COV83_01805 [Candidatus Peregrinibacteria bacterium CG11_big_fil_rev_8_21_14_0_20_49_14]PIR50787.1 MAG: hypothetical protein COU78_05435 [Candidatus Peregrinibacteria bacterium CG10_big_fil_rev_8_21_14_0_10_49_24]